MPPFNFDEHQLESLLKQRKEASRSQNLTLQLSDFSMNNMVELFLEYEYRTTDVVYSEDSVTLQVPVLISEIHASRRLFIESIKLRVLADPKSFSFNFTLQGNLISSVQYDEFASFTKELRDFEQQHPSVVIKDFLETEKALPEETSFTQKVNSLKNNLVTIS
jgi:hypothetical protein